MAINPEKLLKELRKTQIAFSGCNALGVVWDVDGKTEIQSRADVAAVIAAHNPDDRLDQVRARRNALLAACDWTQLQDAALTQEERLAWSAYRQALRDIPQDYADPDNVVWPEAPHG